MKQQTGNEAEPEPGPSEEETTMSKGWTQNPVVIEAICDHLPLFDLKSTRLVCKTWAAAGSVPLAHNNKVTYFGKQSFQDYVNFHSKRVWDTGFRLRHVELVWAVKYDDDNNDWNHSSERPKQLSIDQQWLEQLLLNFELFQLMDSLKIEQCPSDIISNVLMPHVLPRYWHNLKSIEFTRCTGTADFDTESWSLPADAPAPSILKLQTLKFCGHIGTNALEFLKSCHQLQEIKLQCGHGSKDLQILKALEGKNLKSLELDEFILPTVTIPISIKLTDVDPQVLEKLHLRVSIFEASQMTWFTERLPAVHQLPRLKSCQLTFNDLNPRRPQVGGENRLPPDLFQAFSQLHSKGYVGIKGFRLYFDGEPSYSMEFASQTSTSFYLAINFGRDDLEVPYSLISLLFDIYPEVNYLCSPRQNVNFERREPGRVSVNTTLYEVLGRGAVFKLNRLKEEWKLLQPHGAEAEPCQIQQFRRHLESNSQVHDSDFIRRNALFEPDNFPVLGKRGKLYLFDTLTDLWEAWDRVRTCDCDWATIPMGFTPAIVKKGRGNYAFARFFSDN